MKYTLLFVETFFFLLILSVAMSRATVLNYALLTKFFSEYIQTPGFHQQLTLPFSQCQTNETDCHCVTTQLPPQVAVAGFIPE
jgi:hypothetical protein